MTYQAADDLARAARGIVDDVRATLETDAFLYFGNAAIQSVDGRLASAIEILAKAVEQLADDLEIHEH